MMIALGILLFALLVVAHEFGHFVVARRNGVEVEEFGIGFPPRLFGKKYGDTLYSFNLIPLGGFVKLKGETDASEALGAFGAATLWAKTKILLAGVGMNVVATALIIFILALTSLPQIMPSQYSVPGNEIVTNEAVVVAQTVEGSAAARAGLQTGDALLRIDGEPVRSAEALQALTQANAGEVVTVVWQRDGRQLQETVRLAEGGDEGYLGIAPVDLTTTRYTWAAPLVAIGITLQMLWLIVVTLVQTIGSLLAGAGSEAAAQLTGPVGVVYLLQNLGDFGIEFLLFLLASISASLAVFNALPIPALDGGRLAVIAGARALKQPLSERVENAIHATGFLLLMVVFVLITYVDIQRFF